MKLSVGLFSKFPEWQILLDQIGISYFHLKSSQLDPNQIPTIILDQKITKVQQKNLIDYVSSGGALIINAKQAYTIFDKKYKIKKIEYLKFNDNSFFAPFLKCDLEPKHYKVNSDSEFLYTQDENNAIAILNFEKGKIVVLPENFALSVTYTKAKRQNFPAYWGERIPNERVSVISKAVIRQIIADVLKYLFHFRELPFIYLSPIPNGANSCFIFRIDTDMAESRDILKLYDVCKEFKIKATWFVETQSIKNQFNDFKRMQDQEIAYHCYRHKLFKSYKKQKNDIEKGLSLLKRSGINPNGYAAPFGE